MSLRPMFERLIHDRGGNFAMLTGLAAVPLILALGLGIDASAYHNDAALAQEAAEAAALSAAKRLETGTAEDAESDAQLYGQARLGASAKSIKLVNVIDQTKGTVTTTATGVYEPTFARLISIDTLPFERTAVAAIRRSGHMEFHFLMDVSESMNIAASPEDRAKLMETTNKSNGRPCAFACHQVEPNWSPKSVYQMNKEAPLEKQARLRIDVLRDAAKAMIELLLAKNGGPNSLLTIRIQTNGFGAGFKKGVGPSIIETELKASVEGFPSVANSHTNFSAALTGLSKELGKQGTGTSDKDARKVVLMITDGVKDESFSSKGLGPITPSLCDTIKSKNIDLAVLEIKYVEDFDRDGYFRDRVAGYYSKISPSLETCASPGFYSLATDSKDAEAKLLKLTEKLVTQKLHVSQ